MLSICEAGVQTPAPKRKKKRLNTWNNSTSGDINYSYMFNEASLVYYSINMLSFESTFLPPHTHTHTHPRHYLFSVCTFLIEKYHLHMEYNDSIFFKPFSLSPCHLPHHNSNYNSQAISNPHSAKLKAMFFCPFCHLTPLLQPSWTSFLLTLDLALFLPCLAFCPAYLIILFQSPLNPVLCLQTLHFILFS
jgi:hypothetical protein